MAEEKRSIVVFYDDPCIDGAASAWCFAKKYGEDSDVNLKLVPLGHGDPGTREQTVLENVSPDDEVFFVDTAPKDPTLTKLLGPSEEDGDEKTPRVKSVTIWDHHSSEKSRLESFKPKKPRGFTVPELEVEVDIDMPSAALMVWRKLFGDEDPPEFFQWIGKVEPPLTLETKKDRAVAAFLGAQSTRPDTLVATFSELASMPESEIVNKGNAIQADQLNNTEKMLGTVVYAHVELLPGKGKMWVPVVNANVQNFGYAVREALLEVGRLGATCGVSGAWFQKGDLSVNLSILTNGTPNAAEIVQHLGSAIGVGGGGHPTQAVVQFKNLGQFAENVPLFTKEQMLEEQWKPSPEAEPEPGG